jgi:hypothetical protein
VSLVRAHKLKEKMRVNIRTAQERACYLRTSLHLDSLSMRAAAEANTANNSGSGRLGSAITPSALALHSAAASPQAKLAAKRSPLAAMPPSRLPRNNRAAELRLKSGAGQPGSNGTSNRAEPRGERGAVNLSICRFFVAFSIVALEGRVERKSYFSFRENAKFRIFWRDFAKFGFIKRFRENTYFCEHFLKTIIFEKICQNLMASQCFLTVVADKFLPFFVIFLRKSQHC